MVALAWLAGADIRTVTASQPMRAKGGDANDQWPGDNIRRTVAYKGPTNQAKLPANSGAHRSTPAVGGCSWTIFWLGMRVLTHQADGYVPKLCVRRRTNSRMRRWTIHPLTRSCVLDTYLWLAMQRRHQLRLRTMHVQAVRPCRLDGVCCDEALTSPWFGPAPAHTRLSVTQPTRKDEKPQQTGQAPLFVVIAVWAVPTLENRLQAFEFITSLGTIFIPTWHLQLNLATAKVPPTHA